MESRPEGYGLGAGVLDVTKKMGYSLFTRMKRLRKRYVLRSAAELEAIVSPVRHHLLRALSMLGRCSVKELAQQLGRSPESLYYHLRALEAAGLVVERGERVVGGRTEALYATIGEQLVTDPKQTSPDYLDAYRNSVAALMRLANRQFANAVEHQKTTGSTRPVSLRTQQVQARLSPASQRELARRLDDVLQFLVEADDPEQSARVVVTLISAPL